MPVKEKVQAFPHNHLPSLIPQTEEAEKHADDADKEKAKEEEKKESVIRSNDMGKPPGINS